YRSVGLKSGRPFFIVTFHPATNDGEDTEKQCAELLCALDKFPMYDVIFTGANADAGGRVINGILEKYASKSENAVFVHSLGMKRYLSALKYAEAVIGNSSSGIIEAPSFEVPTVNIGSRQEGRVQAKSVINCIPVSEKIAEAINEAIVLKDSGKLAGNVNPYGNGETTDKITEVLLKYVDKEIDLKKKFYDLKFEL
ncbi:MAG: UDP-N-acetylglucosamine 2-epimerase, partial [Clostridia bacterium]|nr:UDP-N-acetylglucosamine 2-epimerase [Clostridia bacterium]